MAIDQNDSEVLGQRTRVDHSDSWVGCALVGLRVSIGWILIQGGLPKLLDPKWNTDTYLARIPETNPFIDFFASLQGNTLIDALNAWGLTLTGIGLVLGALLRWNAFWAVVMMLFYWAANLKGGITEFLPMKAPGWLMDSHMVYAILLLSLIVLGAGRSFGVDAYLEKTDFVKKKPCLRYILG